MKNFRYEEYDYRQDEVESEDESIQDIIEQDEDIISYSESDEELEHPPRGHTGGKWKPEGAAVLDELNEDEIYDEHQGQHPPPNFTGGKWKPTDHFQVYNILYKNSIY